MFVSLCHYFSFQSAEIVPRDPSGPPVLIPERNTDRVGQFSVDLSMAVPHNTSELINQTLTSAVTFLFRMEDITSNNVFYNWTVSKESYSYLAQ